MFHLMNISVERYEKVIKLKDIHKKIEYIRNYIRDNTQFDEEMYIDISEFLYGDIIRLRFLCGYDYHILKDNIGSSELLQNLFEYSKEHDKSTFKIDIFYDNSFMNLLMMYTTYNQRYDTIMDMSYDIRYPNYIRDNDEFNNNIFFDFNLKEIKEFREFAFIFKLDALIYKLDAIIDKTEEVINNFAEDSDEEDIDAKLKLRKYLN